MCPIFVKPVLDIFAVCSLLPRMNLSHTQQRYFMPKKSQLPTREGWFKGSFLATLEGHNTNHNIQIIFQAVVVEIRAKKKNTDPNNKTFF